MPTPELPDRIKATLTIDLDFAKEDQPRISEVLQFIIDNLAISGSGEGCPTAQSRYSFKLESNLPKVPMTLDRILDLADQAAEPGEATARERIAESMHPRYEEASEWWEGLNDAQQHWFTQKHPAVKLVTNAWDVYRAMPFADRTMLDALK